MGEWIFIPTRHDDELSIMQQEQFTFEQEKFLKFSSFNYFGKFHN